MRMRRRCEGVGESVGEFYYCHIIFHTLFFRDRVFRDFAFEIFAFEIFHFEIWSVIHSLDPRL